MQTHQNVTGYPAGCNLGGMYMCPLDIELVVYRLPFASKLTPPGALAHAVLPCWGCMPSLCPAGGTS